MATSGAYRPIFDDPPECPLHLVCAEQSSPVALSETGIRLRAWHVESANTEPDIRRRPTVPEPFSHADDESRSDERLSRTAEEVRAAARLLGRALQTQIRTTTSDPQVRAKNEGARQALAKAHGQLVAALAAQLTGQRSEAVGSALYAADHHASFFQARHCTDNVRHAAENYRRALREVLRYSTAGHSNVGYSTTASRP